MASLAMDDMIAKTGVSLRSPPCGTFMDNVLRQAESIRGKRVFCGVTPRDFKLPMCCAPDIDAVAASLLRDSSWSGISKVPMDAFRTLLTARMSEGMAQSMMNMMIAAS
jgi:hypothetical protein